MKIKVLVINLGWEQEPLIQSLIDKGFEVYGITNGLETDYSGIKKVYKADYRDLDLILKISQDINPNAVISDQCDYSHFAQAYIAERLGLPGPGLKQAQISANKYIQRLAAVKAGIKVPVFKLVTTFEKAIVACEKIGFPVIIKPIDNRGSFGVSKITDIYELKNAYYEALIHSHSRFVLIEQYIQGYEITVDGYCFDGKPKSLAIALKSKEGLKSQVSMDIKYPADIPADVYRRAIENNEFVAESLGYKFGMLHSEYLIDKQNDIYLVESANRGGGVFTSCIIVPTVSGVNILERYIDDAIGINSNIKNPDTIEKNSVVLKFFAFKNGVVKKISGLEEVSERSGVLKCRLNIKEGDEIKTIENDSSRHGFIIYSGKGDLRGDVQNIINQIKVLN
jgi:biotin carboxylase